ncbi:MAG: hypothetical protein IKG27_05985 [Bacilli bacterium]|nr:hypothetical protein [Bacilli bacterium]
MKKFIVKIKNVTEKQYLIDAKNEEEAMKKATQTFFEERQEIDIDVAEYEVVSDEYDEEEFALKFKKFDISKA